MQCCSSWASSTPEEFAVMKGHAMSSRGRPGRVRFSKCWCRTCRAWPEWRWGSSGSALDFLEVARQIAGGHHEKWNGAGYPALGLQGDAIPLPARLMAVADVFDALISRRHYKEPYPDEQVMQIMREGRGQHFDPDVADAFAERGQALGDRAALP